MPRHAVWTPEEIARVTPIICSRLAEGESLRAVCSEEGMPSKGEFLRWVAEEVGAPGGVADQYARAREAQAEGWAEEIVALSDEATDGQSAQAVRVRVDARKWVASKLIPKKYGERVDVTTGGDKLPGGVDLTRLSTETLRRVRDELEEDPAPG